MKGREKECINNKPIEEKLNQKEYQCKESKNGERKKHKIYGICKKTNMIVDLNTSISGITLNVNYAIIPEITRLDKKQSPTIF